MYEYRAKVIRVIDGDTFLILFDLGLGVFKEEKVRLARVDTPETYGVKKDSQEYMDGKRSTKFVVDWLSLNNNEVFVKTLKDKKGTYGRYLVEIFGTVDYNVNINLNDLLLENGLATLYD